jgi:hypothetical protein
MIPRTVQMAKEVSSVFSTPTEQALGNIIYNGYLTVVPNTINKKAWQYKETLTAPINLPTLTQRTPMLKGWTTNYQEYFTQLGPVPGYGTTSGDPTMFEYVVHSFTQDTGTIASLSGLQGGSGYTPGTYTNIATVGGSGIGATLNITVDVSGIVTTVTLNSAGSGYTASDGLTAAPATIGSGTGFAVAVATITVVTPGSQPKWAQPPHRFNQQQVLPFVSPNNNPAAIQYSFVYPVADSPVPPPIDVL